MIKELSGNTSLHRDLILLEYLIQAVLEAVEPSDPHLLTSTDVLYFSKMTDMIYQAGTSAAGNYAEEVMSIATNYVNAASLMLEPHMATQWMGLTKDGVKDQPILSVSPENLSVSFTTQQLLFAVLFFHSHHTLFPFFFYCLRRSTSDHSLLSRALIHSLKLLQICCQPKEKALLCLPRT